MEKNDSVQMDNKNDELRLSAHIVVAKPAAVAKPQVQVQAITTPISSVQLHLLPDRKQMLTLVDQSSSTKL
jgi:hypothetical protein